ncbi:metallophosphoesterase [uncultured Methanobrevibacter sp.]|uniref:metallophosphoesterase n=1 Tax=uncultured Methanobrevibacter sp. TaxID=253161 RepID=UPI002634B70C|nr:metallophosphoesterase [uncultured Methanobrevibacter sp.]
MSNEKFVQLPAKGRLLVVTDLHGNLEDYEKYIELWDCDDPDCHLVFVGDFIHSTDDNDGSIEIIEDAIDKYNKYPNFHPLLGNHEWSHIVKSPVFKGHSNQTQEFEDLIKVKKGRLEPYLSNYVKFFKSMPFFVKTENGLFISHTGPSTSIYNIKDFNKIFNNDYNYNVLHDFLWNRYGDDYTEDDVDNFLKIIDCNCMVVGHTVVDGYFIYGNQVILSSSFCSIDKAYLDIDLSVRINNMLELMNNIKFIEGD